MFGTKSSPEPKSETWSYWALLALAGLLPLAVYVTASVPTIMTKIMVGGFLVLVATIFFAVARMKQQELTVHRSLLLGVLWGIPLSYLLSTLLAAETTISFYGERLTMDSAAFMVIGALVATLTALLLTSQKRALGVYLAMLGSAVVLTVLQLIIFFAREMVVGTGIILSSVSLMGTLNDLAVFFGLISVFTLVSLILLPVSHVMRAILWVVLVASAFFLAVVNLTVLWWILGGFALALFVYTASTHYMARGTARRSISLAPLAVVVLSALFIFGSNTLTGSVAEWVNVGELDVRPSWQTTVGLANTAYAGSRIFGTGPDTFTDLWSLHMPAEISQTVFWQADFAFGIGLIPTAVIATGLVGLAAWLLFFGVFIWRGVRTFLDARKVERGDINHYLRVTSFVGALFLWIITVIQVPSPVLVLYAFMLTGVFIAVTALGNEHARPFHVTFHENPRAGFLVTLSLTFLVLLSVGMMFSMGTRYLAEASYQKAVRVVTQGGDINEAEALLEKAIGRHSVDTYYRLLSNVDIVRMQQLLAGQEAPEAIRDKFQTLLARSVGNAQQATILDEGDYQNWANIGTIYQSIVPLGIDGSTDSASSAFARALELRPNSAQIYLARATLARQQGNNASAKEEVKQAIALRPNYTDALFLLAQVELEENNVEEAMRSVESVTFYEPKNPVGYFQLGLLKYGTEDFAGAITSLDQAVVLNPQYANARYFLGLSYWRLGNAVKAREQFEEVLKTNPDNQEVIEIVNNLTAGRDPFVDQTPADDIQSLEGLPLPEGDENAPAVLTPDVRGLAE